MKLLLSLAAATATFLPFGGERADLVTKVYDLTSAAPEVDLGEFQVPLVPCLRYRGNDQQSSNETHIDADSVAQFVLSVFEREFQYEGRSFEVDSRGRMHVVAPAAIHKDIAALLALLEGVQRRSVELRVDLVERPAGAPLLPATMALDEADKLVAGSPTVRTSNLSIAPGRIATADSTRSIEVVCDFDVEIAQSASIVDPVVQSFALGSQVFARAAAMRGGVELALVVKDVKLAKPLEDLEFDLGGTISTDQGAQRFRERSAVRLPSVMQRSLALSAFVPEGQAAIVETATNVQSGASRVAIVLRASVVGKEPITGLALPSIGTRVDLLDLSAVAPPRMQLEDHFAFYGMQGNVGGRLQWTEEDVGYATLMPGDTSMFEMALAQGGAHDYTNTGPWMFIRPSSESTAPADTAAVTLAHPAFASAETLESVSLALTLRRGTATLAQWSGPFAGGEWSAIYLGGESLAIGDIDVEVAQSASAVDPKIRLTPDGAVLTVRPSRAQDGSWTVELRVLARVLAGAPTLSTSIGTASVPIQTAEYDEMAASERVLLGAAPRGRKVVLGTSGSLQLELELR